GRAPFSHTQATRRAVTSSRSRHVLTREGIVGMDWLVEAYWLLTFLVLVASAFLTLHTWEHRRFARSRVTHSHESRPPRGRVAVFVPCKGADADLQENLRPLFEQDHPDYALTFVVESGADSDCQVIHQLMSAYPRQSTR